MLDDICPVNKSIACIRKHKRGEYLDQCSFARAVRSQQAEHLSLWNRQIDLVQCGCGLAVLSAKHVEVVPDLYGAGYLSDFGVVFLHYVDYFYSWSFHGRSPSLEYCLPLFRSSFKLSFLISKIRQEISLSSNRSVAPECRQITGPASQVQLHVVFSTLVQIS